MTLTDDFDEAYVTVEEEDHFLPFVGGDAAKTELCATAAKRCLGVPASASLDPWEAAARVGITVRDPDHFAALDPSIREPLIADSSSWSGGAISVGESWVVILNPLHAPARQRATLAEELTHIVMGHPPSTIDSVTGARTYNVAVEEEAYGVGGAMLLPYSHLFWRVKRGSACSEMAAHYEVSEPFVSYRINRCGLRRMYDRAASS